MCFGQNGTNYLTDYLRSNIKFVLAHRKENIKLLFEERTNHGQMLVNF